jgi:hypothetical protein
MTNRPLLGATAPLLAGLAGFLLVLFSADPEARGAAGLVLLPGDTPTVVTEPAVFVGLVEVTGDERRGYGVLLSTATEEVVVADNAVSRTLAAFQGEVVAVRGRLIERSEAPPTMVVSDFRVLGLPRPETAPRDSAGKLEIAC